MEKIKEIRKIESPIKEIKKEKKAETLEDELSEENDDSSGFTNGFRRFNKTSTLDTKDIPQEKIDLRERKIAKEDEAEMHFRPSYVSAGNNNNSYTPVGAAESAAVRRDAGVPQERNFGNQNDLQQGNFQTDTMGMAPNRNENDSGRVYAGVEEQEDKRRRRANAL